MHKVVMPYFHTLIMKIDTLLKRHLTKENLIIMALWKAFLTFVISFGEIFVVTLSQLIFHHQIIMSSPLIFPWQCIVRDLCPWSPRWCAEKKERKIKNEFCLHHLERHRRLPPLVSYQKPVLCHRKMRW